MPGAAALTTRFLTARFLTAGLRALPAATREAGFLGGRWCEGRVERFERDLGAMIPLSPALRHHAMAGLPESPRRAVFHLPIGLRHTAHQIMATGRPGGGCRPGSRRRHGVRASPWPRSTSRAFVRRYRG